MCRPRPWGSHGHQRHRMMIVNGLAKGEPRNLSGYHVCLPVRESWVDLPIVAVFLSMTWGSTPSSLKLGPGNVVGCKGDIDNMTCRVPNGVQYGISSISVTYGHL